MIVLRKYFFTLTAAMAALSIGASSYLLGHLDILSGWQQGDRLTHLLVKIDQVGFVLLAGLITLLLIVALGFFRLTRGRMLLISFLLVFVLTLLVKGKFENMGTDSMAEMMHANAQESADFIESYISFINLTSKEAVVLFAPLLLLPCYALLLKRAGCTQMWAGAALTDIRRALLLIAAVYLATGAHFLYQLAANYHPIDYFRERLEGATAQGLPDFARRRNGPNVVVYIGESASKENLPLYISDPEVDDPLRSYRDELIVYSDVVAPFSHTFPSLYRAFSVSRDPYGEQFLLIKDLQRPNVLAILNASGVEAHWISNQNLVGRWDWNSELFGRHARHLHVLNEAEHVDEGASRKTDRALLAAYREHAGNLDRPGQMMFLHSYAGHADYCKNIPRDEFRESGRVLPPLPQKALFGDKYVGDFGVRMRSIECYDSVMSFVSKNLRAVIENVSRRATPTVFLYFADHGEEIFEGTGHDSRQNSFRHIEIPFVIYFNDAARQAYPELHRAALANRDQPYSIEWLSDSLLDLAGLDSKRRPLLSVFRPGLRSPPRYTLRRTDIRGNQFILALDAEDASRRHGLLNQGHDYYHKRRIAHSLAEGEQQRLCAQSANSLLKFREAASIFACVEVDITVDAANGKLHAYRPPQENNYLELADLVRFGPPVRQMRLVVSNADNGNLKALQARLDQVFAPAWRRHVIVEIAHQEKFDMQQLRALADAGYHLSYALPDGVGAACARQPQQGECARFQHAILPELARAGVQGIAFEAAAYPYVDSLPEAQQLEYGIKDFSVRAGGDIAMAMLARSKTYSIPYRSAFDY